MVPAISLEDKNKLDIKIYKPSDFVDSIGDGDWIVMEKNTSGIKVQNIESVTQTIAIGGVSQDTESGMANGPGPNMARVRPFIRYNVSSGRQVLQLHGGNQRYQITTRNEQEDLGEYFTGMYNQMQRLLN